MYFYHACSLKTLLNYCTIIQNLYSTPVAINASEGLHLKQVIDFVPSSFLFCLCQSCTRAFCLYSNSSLMQTSLPAPSIGKIESDVCNSIPQIEKNDDLGFLLAFAPPPPPPIFS